MRLHLIVMKDRQDPPYVVEAWDEYSIDENEKGFAEALAKVKKGAGSSEVRVGIVNVPDSFLQSLFNPIEVHASVPTVVSQIKPQHSQWHGQCVPECVHPDHKES